MTDPKPNRANRPAAMIALAKFEEELSTARRSLHTVIDSVNDELARRITGGESPVHST